MVYVCTLINFAVLYPCKHMLSLRGEVVVKYSRV